MIANFFNKTKPVNIFNVVVLLFLFYFIPTFLGDSIEFSWSFLLDQIVVFFWLVLFLLIFKFIVKKNKLTKDNAYSLLLVVLILGAFPEAIFTNYIIFSNLVLLLGYRKIYSLRSGVNTNTKIFDAAFWIGVATLIYSWSIFYLILIYIAIIIYEKVNIKNLLIPIIGFLTPIFIYFTYEFYFDNLTVFLNRFKYDINLDFSPYNFSKFIIPILFLVIILVWAIVKVTPKIVSISNNLKFSWNTILNHLLISVIIIGLSPVKNGSEMFYLVFPSAIIIANFLQNSKSSIFKNVILYLFLIIAVSIYFL